MNPLPEVVTQRAESPSTAEAMSSQLAVAVHAALMAAKIEIPFPQRDVHIRSTEERLPPP